MRTACVTVLAVALAALSAPWGAAAADDLTLKWSFKEGDTFYATTTVDSDMKIEAMGNKIPVKSKMVTVTRFRVKSAKPGARTVELTYLDMRMEAAGLPGAGGIGEKLKGATLTATFDDDFQVTKLEGYEKFLDKLGGDDPTQRKLMEAIMSEDNVRQMYTQVFLPLPAKPVQPKDTWNRSDKVALAGFGTLTTKRKFKLDSESGGVAKISETADVTFKAGGGGKGGLPFKITKGDLKADDYKGAHLFDTKAGRLKESRTEMTLSGSLTVAAGGQEIELGLDGKSVTRVEVTDKNPVRD